MAAALLCACANTRQEPLAQINDPYEKTNRDVLRSNQAALGPVAQAVHTIPAPIRDRLSDFDANLKEPRILANNLLQLRFEAAGKTLTRFVVNSTLGVGGLYDVAGHNGLTQQSGDFGQTLYVWGFSDGPYLVLPILGPSTGRDAVGLGVDIVADPVSWALSTQFGHAVNLGVAGIDFTAQIDQLKLAEEGSVDFYSFLRSSYYQNRRAQLREAVGLPPMVESPADDEAVSATPASQLPVRHGRARRHASAAAARLNKPPQ
jgi:phospholipid-binding lipoprotein MlaA